MTSHSPERVNAYRDRLSFYATAPMTLGNANSSEGCLQ